MYVKGLLYLVRSLIFAFSLLFILILALLAVSASELECYPSTMITKYIIYEDVEDNVTVATQKYIGYLLNQEKMFAFKQQLQERQEDSGFECSTTRIFNTFRRMDDSRYDIDDLSGESYIRTCKPVSKKPHLEIPLPLSLRPDSRTNRLRNLGYKYTGSS